MVGPVLSDSATRGKGLPPSRGALPTRAGSAPVRVRPRRRPGSCAGCPQKPQTTRSGRPCSSTAITVWSRVRVARAAEVLDGVAGSMGPRASSVMRRRLVAQGVEALRVGGVVDPEAAGGALDEGPDEPVQLQGVAEPLAVRGGQRRLDDRGAARLDGRRVGLDHRALPLALHDGHHDGAGLGAVEGGVGLDHQAADELLGHPHLEDVVVEIENAQGGEGVRVEVGAVPRVEPVGDDVLGVAACLHPDHALQEERRVAGRGPASAPRGPRPRPGPR